MNGTKADQRLAHDMTSTVLSIRDIPGSGLRRVLRWSMTTRQPWALIVDTRTSPPPTLDRIATLLRLTRRARRLCGEVVVVVDDATRQRLFDAGLDRWLRLAGTVDEARTRAALPSDLPTPRMSVLRGGYS